MYISLGESLVPQYRSYPVHKPPTSMGSGRGNSLIGGECYLNFGEVNSWTWFLLYEIKFDLKTYDW